MGRFWAGHSRLGFSSSASSARSIPGAAGAEVTGGLKPPPRIWVYFNGVHVFSISSYSCKFRCSFWLGIVVQGFLIRKVNVFAGFFSYRTAISHIRLGRYRFCCLLNLSANCIEAFVVSLSYQQFVAAQLSAGVVSQCGCICHFAVHCVRECFLLALEGRSHTCVAGLRGCLWRGRSCIRER